MIVEKAIPNIIDHKIIINKKPIPQSSNKSLPILYNTQLYTGSKGRGKSYSLVSLLNLYENSKISDGIFDYQTRIILFAPTAYSSANSIYQTLKTLDKKDIHLEYSDELLQQVLDDIKAKSDDFQEYLNYKTIYDKFKKNKKKIKNDDLSILEAYDFQTAEDIFGDIKPQVNFIIFDDLIGTGSFNRKSKNLITNLTIKHRHLKTNLIFTTQGYSQIPPIIRNNIDIYVIFKSASYKEVLDKIYKELSGYLTYDDFKEAYEYATKENHDALIIINNSMDKGGLELRRNWNHKLDIKKD